MSSDTITKKSVSSVLAARMIAAAEAKARELGIPMAISIADESGIQKAFVRMDGAPLLAIQVAVNKAKTAAGFGIPTHVWHDFIKDDAPLALGAPHIPDLVVFGGGYPIKVDDAMIGAIGVSGGHYSDDMKVAEAALAVVS
ncbi:hypothetical protein N825_09680 [Skermanella stibiiresistens SB22]|uniref:PduO protein n=1 Tax=Skermanella stibiiresistens SB22 TaxID=1385369 RepID=W9GZF6_9PROT|nr:heme-binding protein [Skermanella stibiiresistens]EWY37842.1 hypothetical protein N825_09680 [Skermanella stibiiresistens SB22]